MPIVTSIKPQKNQRRVNIYLDDKFGFGIDLENFVKYGLKVEQELTDEEIQKIVKEAEFQKVYDKILRFASIRPRSEKEFEVWLKKHRVHESLYKDLFNRLARLDFLNDEKFSAWWVEQRQMFRPKSRRIISHELRMKGIKKEIIEKVLTESKIDEEKMVSELLKKNKRRWGKLDDFEARKKKVNFLLQRGFGWDIIGKVIKNTSFEE